jgi:hypothetical protein
MIMSCWSCRCLNPRTGCNHHDNLICVVLLATSPQDHLSPSPVFLQERLLILGSIPSFGAFKYAGLFRLARLSRLARIVRLLRGQRGQEIITDVLTHRAVRLSTVTAAGRG